MNSGMNALLYSASVNKGMFCKNQLVEVGPRVCVCVCVCVCVYAQSCPTLSDPMDFSLPGSSAHGILQARVLEWVSIAFSA